MVTRTCAAAAIRRRPGTGHGVRHPDTSGRWPDTGLSQVGQYAGQMGLGRAAKSLLVSQDKAAVNISLTLTEAELSAIMNLAGLGKPPAPAPATKSSGSGSLAPPPPTATTSRTP